MSGTEVRTELGKHCTAPAVEEGARRCSAQQAGRMGGPILRTWMEMGFFEVLLGIPWP